MVQFEIFFGCSVLFIKNKCKSYSEILYLCEPLKNGGGQIHNLLNMNKIAIFKRLLFVSFITLFGVISNAQTPTPTPTPTLTPLNPSGTNPGSANNPYLISSAADWNKFAADVNGGCSYSGKIVQLAADIPTDDEIYDPISPILAITTMVGVWDATEVDNSKPFSGTFKGDGKTITINYSSSTADNYTAPFRCTNGALITNDFTVIGDINATNGYAAGLVGVNYGSQTIVNSNVTVRVNITGNTTYCGGVAVDATNLAMSSCIYNGQIVAGDYSAGFCAKGDNSTKFNKCLYNPDEGSSITGEHTANFINGNYNSTNSNNYYYTYNTTPDVTSTQGTCVYTSYSTIPGDDKFRLRIKLDGNNYFYVEGQTTITGLESMYYQNNAQGGGINYDVKFNIPYDSDYNNITVDPVCYTAEIIDSEDKVVDDISTITPGTYYLRITGKEGYCSGMLSQSFNVIANVFDHGSGTEDDPYQIGSEDEWNAFAKAVNSGHTFEGEFLKLTKSNLEVSRLVGKNKNYFKGVFDGQWDTIIFNKGDFTNPCDTLHCAPFSSVAEGATIKNLTVNGTIVSKKRFAAGLVGWIEASGSVYITNCTSNITINCSKIEKGDNKKPYDCSSGGFVGQIESGQVCFENCVFVGSITKGTEPHVQSSANRCAGFVSFIQNGSITYKHCTMAGTVDIDTYRETFNRNGKHTFSEAYYINNYNGSSPQGSPATTTEPTTDIAKKYDVSTTKSTITYFVPGSTITGLEETVFQHTGKDITITPVVEYYGRTLIKGSDKDYTISIEKKNGNNVYEPVGAIKDAGDYHYIISGAGNYGGSLTTDIKVIQLNSWAALMEAMSQSKGTFTLTENIVATNPRTTDLALQVTGNITLNLNGKKIDRNLEDSIEYGQVIRVGKNASLTINGPGTITGGFSYPGTDQVPNVNTYYDKRDAGGIHNMGNLVLYDVTIEHNKCVMEEEVPGVLRYSARGGGVYCGKGSTFVMDRGAIKSNEARGGGGGVYCDDAKSFVMTDVDVWANISESKGGGIRIRTTGSNKAYLTDCDISWANMVTIRSAQGGGIFLESGELVMTNCNINGNSATMQGAGLYSLTGKTTAINCNITLNGTLYNHRDNYGAGIYLNDNKGTLHSIYIMDGGTISDNNCIHDGGGIFVADGAVFQIKGNVVIKDNLSAWMQQAQTDNNAYIKGESVIEVVGPLGEDAMINITPSSSGAHTYVTFAEGVSSDGWLQHFSVDDTGYTTIIDESGNIEVYEPYPWNKTATWKDAIAENSSGDETIPTEGSDLEIHRSIRIPSGYVASAKSISTDDYCNIIIEDGGQLLNDSEDVNVLAKKNIVGASDTKGAGGWYIISSPAAAPSITDKTNLITGTSY